MLPQYKASQIPEYRKLIHESKQLNALLSSNLPGLKMFFEKAKNAKGLFDFGSCQKMFQSIMVSVAAERAVMHLKLQFVYS
jgi:hypothetical protein